MNYFPLKKKEMEELERLVSIVPKEGSIKNLRFHFDSLQRLHETYPNNFYILCCLTFISCDFYNLSPFNKLIRKVINVCNSKNLDPIRFFLFGIRQNREYSNALDNPCWLFSLCKMFTLNGISIKKVVVLKLYKSQRYGLQKQDFELFATLLINFLISQKMLDKSFYYLDLFKKKGVNGKIIRKLYYKTLLLKNRELS